MKKIPRYKPNEAPAYHRLFNYRQAHSLVLNPQAATINPVQLSMGNRQGLTTKAAEYQDRLTNSLALVDAITGQFAKMQADAQAEGRPALAVMPDHLLKELHEAEARADVHQLEVTLLKNLLAECTGRQEVEAGKSVLVYGPRGSRRGTSIFNPDSRERTVVPIIEIDGQAVKIINGTPYIADKRSPYDGLKVETYWEKIVTPWLASHRDGTIPVRSEHLPPRP